MNDKLNPLLTATDLETVRMNIRERTKIQDPLTYAQTPPEDLAAKLKGFTHGKITQKWKDQQHRTDEKGMRFNQGKPRWWTLVDFNDFSPMVDVLEYGAIKYDTNQWKKGLELDGIMDSCMRHMIALQGGQERDPESGCLHIGHIMCNIYFYSHFYLLKQKENECKNSEQPGGLLQANMEV